MRANFYSDLVLSFAHLSEGPSAGRWLGVSGLGTSISLWNSEVLRSHGARVFILVMSSWSACCILGPLLSFFHCDIVARGRPSWAEVHTWLSFGRCVFSFQWHANEESPHTSQCSLESITGLPSFCSLGRRWSRCLFHPGFFLGIAHT